MARTLAPRSGERARAALAAEAPRRALCARALALRGRGCGVVPAGTGLLSGQEWAARDPSTEACGSWEGDGAAGGLRRGGGGRSASGVRMGQDTSEVAEASRAGEAAVALAKEQ